MRLGRVAVAVALGLAAPALAERTGGAQEAVLIDPDELHPPRLHVNAFASTGEVLLGARFSLFVVVTHTAGLEVNLPTALPVGDALELGERSVSRSVRADGMHVMEVEIEAMAWHVGELVVPPLPVTYARRGVVTTVASPAVPLRVAGLVGDGPAELRDIRAPGAVLVPAVDFRAWLRSWRAAAFAAALALVAAALALRRRARRTRSEPAAAPLPPGHLALARLDALEASLTRDHEVGHQASFLAMSEIVRAYLGQRFGAPCTDATTAELDAALAARAGAEALRSRLAPWLERCDLVKYAGAHASLADARAALADARRIIEEGEEGERG